MNLTTLQEDKLRELLTALFDQSSARVIVPPQQNAEGFWFGAGNAWLDDETVWLSGRYRNAGDSRAGLEKGARGVSCNVFRADRGSSSFEQVAAWSKLDLTHDASVLSIEGSSLHRWPDGTWELYVSTEKEEAYPPELARYQKQGTGVWSIDRMRGPAPDAMDPSSLTRALSGAGAEHLHVKDPVVLGRKNRVQIVFSAHPVSWASSNSGLAVGTNPDGDLRVESWQIVDRGAVWDVAVTRITDILTIPKVGVLAGTPEIEILLYDGAESMRQLDENPRGMRRPRGWSCEEIGGAMWAPAGEWAKAKRLSVIEPLFTSPHGTGSSRYAKTLVVPEGIHAFWQQARADGSQPLVTNFLSRMQFEALLS